MTRRAALYLRVSTVEQTEANQLPDLDALCARRGWEPVEYRETGSAAKERPVLEQLMRDARAGKLGAVVVWALDRLDRNMVACLLRVAELDRLSVAVVSCRESWLDTSGPARSLLVAVFGWVAEQERARLIERTRAGIDRARKEGKHIGRPRASPVLLHAAAELVPDIGIRRAAASKGIPEASLRRFLRSRAAGGYGTPLP